MIVFELQCSNGHRFEVWFHSGDVLESQSAAGAVACPLCDDTHVRKAPMAPYVARRGGHGSEDAPPAKPETGEDETLRGALQRLRRFVEQKCDYVGTAFPEEARRIHYGEVDPRGIYGEATDAEARALDSEGVAVRRIPWLPRRDD